MIILVVVTTPTTPEFFFFQGRYCMWFTTWHIGTNFNVESDAFNPRPSWAPTKMSQKRARFFVVLPVMSLAKLQKIWGTDFLELVFSFCHPKGVIKQILHVPGQGLYDLFCNILHRCTFCAICWLFFKRSIFSVKKWLDHHHNRSWKILKPNPEASPPSCLGADFLWLLGPFLLPAGGSGWRMRNFMADWSWGEQVADSNFTVFEAIMAISNKKLQKIMTLGNFITQLVPQAGSQRLLGFFIAASFLRLLIGHGAVDRVQLLTIWTCWFIKRFSMLVHRCQDLITASWVS